MSLWQMSPEQLRRYALDEIEPLLPHASVAPPDIPEHLWSQFIEQLDDEMVEYWRSCGWDGTVGVWRCPSGEITCREGMCSDSCGCCSNADLWESPIIVAEGWGPECATCGRKAVLVRVLE